MRRASKSSRQKLALAVIVVSSVLPTASVAQARGAAPTRLEQTSPAERERARGLMDDGDQMMARGDARGALAAYTAADEIVRVPTTGIEVGRAQRALGQWVEARDTWVRVARYPKRADEPRPFTEARLEAERLAMDLGTRIPTLVVEIERPLPRGLAVHLDGRLLATDLLNLPLRVNPGVHVVQARAPECEGSRVDVELEERSERRVVVLLVCRMPEPPAAQPSRESTEHLSGTRALMWTGFGLAAAGLAVGTATGIWAFERTALASEQCNGTDCPASASADIHQAKTAGIISTVAFAAGGLGLGVGVWQAVALAQARRGVSGEPPGPSAGAGLPRQMLSLSPTIAGASLAYTWRFP